MIRDLRSILEGWDYEPGKISVRKIIGRDGREKIQTRIDLGVLQLEADGRPDGKRPYGCESVFDYHERRLREHISKYGDDADFILSCEDCRELRHEAYLYYQRFLSQFVLEEYDSVDRDTDRNLRLIDFCERYGASEQDREAMLSQRGYVLMMNVRAQVYDALEQDAYDSALRRVETGILELRELPIDEEEWDEQSTAHDTELTVLLQLRREVLSRMPDDAMPRLQWELQAAIEREDYEGAAKLRDMIRVRSEAT